MKKKKSKKYAPYIRDVYLAKLIDGARLTELGFPIIEKRMVETELPKDIIQRDCKSCFKDNKDNAISFYCNDQYFQNVISNPDKYIKIFEEYKCIIGLDASPFDNMPLVVQYSQIFINLAFTYYLGRRGFKIIPNVRLGDNRTYISLDAYPKHTLIAIGTNGFIKDNSNLIKLKKQIIKIIDTLEPSGILIYGKDSKNLIDWAYLKGIPVYQYDSFICKRRQK